MDDSTVIEDPVALSAELMRSEHAYMARWLALAVLMDDEVVCADEELYGRLSVFQEQQEKQMLAKHGMT
jgi:hypothetical protein